MRTKTLRNLFFLLFIFTVFAQTLKSQVLMYDNFSYPAGDTLTWHNWLIQQTSLTNAIIVANEGLSYTGYPCSGIGNSAAVGTSGQDVFRGFTKQTLPGSSLYMAVLAKVTAGASGDAFITFKESPTSPTNLNYRGRVYAKIDASSNVSFGISKGAISAPATANYTPASYSLNTTYLLVVKYKIIEGTANDSAFLFVNPGIGSTEPLPSVTATDISAADVGLGSVMLRQGTAGSSPTVIVDGVRVAKTWLHALNISNIATLSDLKIDASSASGFNPEAVSYNDTVPAGQTSVVVTSTLTDWAATATTTTASAIPGISTIHVTAEDGITTKTYTITHAYAYFTIDVSAQPVSNGNVSGNGIYGEGFSASVMAIPATDFAFLNWTEAGTVVSTNSTYIFNVTANRSLVANFVPALLQITATATPFEGGTITGTGPVAYGATAILTAHLSAGYDFMQWTEGSTVLGTNPVLTISNVTSNHDVQAQFVQQAFNIIVTANPPEGGTVSGSTAVSYGSGATVSASANSGYIFENWTENGTVIGTNPELVLTNITANHNITGNFIASVNTFTVSATANPAQGGFITGAGNVLLGESITLTAVANAGYVFLYWTEDGIQSVSNPQITLTNVIANHNLVANFLSTVGIFEPLCGGIKIRTSSASGFLTVATLIEIREISVFDISGKKVLSHHPGSNLVRVNTSGWKKGVYLIRLLTSEGIETRKVLVY